jgi:hypothetical protein
MFGPYINRKDDPEAIFRGGKEPEVSPAVVKRLRGATPPARSNGQRLLRI